MVDWSTRRVFTKSRVVLENLWTIKAFLLAPIKNLRIAKSASATCYYVNSDEIRRFQFKTHSRVVE